MTLGDIILDEEEAKFIKDELDNRRKNREFHNKMCEGLMKYYASDDWQQHIKRVQWWASLSTIEKLFTKKPSDII